MKRIALITAMAAMASVVLAKPKLIYIPISLGAATGGTNTSEKVVGYVEEVQMSVSDGAATGLCSVAIQPADSTVAAYNLATNTVSDEKRFYPVRDNTDIAGTALTSDTPGRYFLIGDTVTFTVTGSSTNKTWRCRIKITE